MENTGNKIKIVFLFWIKVLEESVKSLDIRGKVLESIITVIIVLFVSALSATGLSNLDFIKTIWQEITGRQPDAWLIVSITIVFYFFLTVLYEPAKLYARLGGFVRNPFSLSVYKSKKEKEKNEAKWVSINVKNISPANHIEDCFLELTDIINLKTEKSVLNDIQKLTWSAREHNKEISGNQPIRIVANNNAVCDLARTNVSGLLWEPSAYYTTWFGLQEIDSGEYSATITIYGNYQEHPIHYKYQVKLYFKKPNTIRIDEPVLIKSK